MANVLATQPVNCYALKHKLQWRRPIRSEERRGILRFVADFEAGGPELFRAKQPGTQCLSLAK